MGKTTPLQAAQAAQANEATEKKARGVLASLAALLGVNTDAQPPKAEGKAKRTVEKYSEKREKLEEVDTDSEEEEEEEEEKDSASDMSSDGGTESSASESEEEEEEEEEERAASEEEEEKALARAIRAAYKAPAVKAAFLAAIPKAMREKAALRAPDRFAREVRRATGAKTIDDAMTALSRQRADATAPKPKAKPARAALPPEVIRANAKTEARVAKLESEGRAQRVNAIVDKAKAEGRAPSKNLRAQLRAYGMANGTKALRDFVATLPAVRTDARTPDVDDNGAPKHLPSAGAQLDAIDAAAVAGMNPAQRQQYDAVQAAVNAAKSNGAGAIPKA